ncbi:MAG TPA: conjugal transfer protein TrbA, partial [Burkholderiaceae bacterium]|nr:conjugal transfer protein TrbA [Burkholderiaceae bacterium]
LGLVDAPWMPAAVGRWRAESAALASAPHNVNLTQLLDVMNTAGYFFVVIPLAMTVRAIVAATRHRANLTRRRVDATTLPWIMAKHAPAVIPALYYGDSKTQLLNVDPPEHRSAVAPEEWVREHGLLVNGRLDRAKARELLVADLGTRIERLDELRPHERAMFAVFGTRLLSDRTDIARAQALLDDLNRSCHKGTHEGKKGYPQLGLAEDAFRQYARHPQAAQWLRKHPYPCTLLHSMHKEALTLGALASSHFRWLKGIDRGLWYALNTTGRKVSFIESAAVFTQAMWEDFAHNCGYELTEPYVDDAINGVESYLIKIGLMESPQQKE